MTTGDDWEAEFFDAKKAVLAIRKLIDTIEATGGLVKDEHGDLVPYGDPTWSDLADAYLAACRAVGKKPEIHR